MSAGCYQTLLSKPTSLNLMFGRLPGRARVFADEERVTVISFVLIERRNVHAVAFDVDARLMMTTVADKRYFPAGA